MSISSDDPRQDKLVLDITRDLERVNSVMTRVVNDPLMVDEFIRDPSGVLTRLGLHPRTTREIHDQVNRVFYSVLTNTALLELIVRHFETFSGPTASDIQALNSALEHGEIENPIEFDLRGFEHFASDKEVLRQAFRLTLADLNNRRILVNQYSSEQINEYVDELVSAIVERRAVRDFPILEAWDDNYGIGKPYGGIAILEVGPTVTAVACVEVGAIVTVVVEVNVVADAERMIQRQAILGNPRSARKLAMIGTLFRLAGELLVHTNNFERSYD